MVQAEKRISAEESPGIEPNESGGSDLAGRKRAAVELIRNHDTQLRSSARRYSICGDDAEDAYQRGIEILLSKAPTTDLRQLLPWTRTVIKHEALAVRKSRERTLGRPSSVPPDDDSENWVNLIPSTSDGPDERVVKKEKVARSREALAHLKPQELKALTMLAEGYSYAEIASINSWTHTKVNRCLAEGRKRFRSVFRESESGDRCASFEPLLSACCDGEVDPEKLTEIENHLAACGHCRATLRTYRAAPKAAAALLPAAPLAHSLWERVQEGIVSAQLKVQGLGRGSESGVSSVAVSGGTRGAGAAVLAKVAAICAGTAGGAAMCIATGVIPAPDLVHDRTPEPKPAISRTAGVPGPVMPSRPQTEPDEPVTPAPKKSSPEPAPQPQTAAQPQAEEPPAPPPTPTETEFTPEAAGTPVPATAPVPPAPVQSGSVPVGGGGGEFGP